jgi:hypothetical protein
MPSKVRSECVWQISLVMIDRVSHNKEIHFPAKSNSRQIVLLLNKCTVILLTPTSSFSIAKGYFLLVFD